MTRWAHDTERYAQNVKIFHALIGKPEDANAKRVSVEALNLQEAKAKLEAEFGAGNVLSLWVDAEWQMPRGKI